MPIFTTLLVH